MKRMYYVSRFARHLTRRDLAEIHETAVRNNLRDGITGFLVCLGDTFFQVLEGPDATVDQLYHKRILPDSRHKDVCCLKAETGWSRRLFPRWSMEIFNLNEPTSTLPFAFREMLSALLESSQTIARYTQSSVLAMLERGVNPASVRPRRRRVTVMFSDIIGFSLFAERLPPTELVELVNRHADICSTSVNRHGGEVNKLTGDGVLSYFAGDDVDGPVAAAEEILEELERMRSAGARRGSLRWLDGGVGLTHGLVFEGNVGSEGKQDFTIIGGPVNLASRLEGLTRELEVRLTVGASVVRRSRRAAEFVSLGGHSIKGHTKPVEVYTLRNLPRLDIDRRYAEIRKFVARSKAGRKRSTKR